MVLASGSHLTSFCAGVKIDLVCVRAETSLVFLYGSKLTWFLERGSKLTWFLSACQNDLFLVWASIGFVFVRVVEIDSVFV